MLDTPINKQSDINFSLCPVGSKCRDALARGKGDFEKIFEMLDTQKEEDKAQRNLLNKHMKDEEEHHLNVAQLLTETITSQ